MTSRQSRCIPPFALAVIAVLLGLAGGLAGAEKQTFRARVIKPDFPNNITVKVDISEFSTPEEIAALRSAMDEGERAFRKTFRKTAKGNLMFYGIEQPSIKFYAAFEAPTEKGRAIALFAENRTILTGPGQAYTGLLFLVVTLEVDAEGNGEGRLYENAYIKFTSDGRLDLESYRTVPAQLIQVRPAK
ncbi:MAG: hypothetical protein FJY80_06510 [Candidatus Aminicenantes bacterium]|nr:hypothetical protein [Candidatus Aminicenantes bacterium]